ncbi:hypothetical protein PENTCL1PPCAC_25315, partial [Pristionchus entomophagus]
MLKFLTVSFHSSWMLDRPPITIQNLKSMSSPVHWSSIIASGSLMDTRSRFITLRACRVRSIGAALS